MTRLVACSLTLVLAACSESKSDSSEAGAGAPAETGGSSGAGGGAGSGTGGSKAGTGGSLGFAGAGGTMAGGGGGGAGGAAGSGPPLARTFTQRESGVTGDLAFLATSGDVVVAAGSGDLVYSDDGVTWTLPDPPIAATAVAYGGGTFVALAEMGLVYTSPDGRAWTSTMPFSETSEVDHITYAFGKFFAVEFSVSGIGYVTSPDGITWTGVRPMFSNSSDSSEWTNVSWVISAGEWLYMSSTWGTPGHNFGSQDGVTWEIIDDWASLTTDVTFDGTTYCAVGVYSSGASTDGVTWTTTGGGPRGVTNWNGVFWSSGGFGSIRASRDCNRWEAGADPVLPDYLPNSLQANLEVIRVHRDRLIAVGDGGRIWTSP